MGGMNGPGTLLDGRFELLEPIADYGHGETWRARDTRLRNRAVALKLLGEGGAAVDATGRRLVAFRHGAVLATLHHGVAEGGVYLVHELFEAPSLATLLARSWRDGALLPKATLERLTEKLCEALDAAHALSPPLVHGALHAGGVLVQRASPQGVELRVADFGHTALLLPAHAAGAEGVRADIAALGALLRAAFAAPAAPGEAPAPAGQDWRRDDLPDALWSAVERATAARPEDRFADIESLQHALEAAWRAPLSGPATRPVASAAPLQPAPAEAVEAAPPPPEAPPEPPPAPAPTAEPEAAATEFVERPVAARRARPAVSTPSPDEGATTLTPRPSRPEVPAAPAVGERTAELASAWGGDAIEAPTEGPTTFVVKPAAPSAASADDAVFTPRAPKGGGDREVGAHTVAASAGELQRAAQNLPDPVIARTEFVMGTSSGPPTAPQNPQPPSAPAASGSSSRALIVAGVALAAVVLGAVLVAVLR